MLLLALFGVAYLLAFPMLALYFLGRAAAFGLGLDFQLLAQNALASVLFALVALLLHRIRPQPPALMKLEASDATKLFGMIEHVRAHFDAPPLEAVYLDGRVDVGMLYTPRNGYPFDYSRSLVVGMPALQLLSPLHFKGLVARRLGQASRRSNRLTAWLVSLRYFGRALLDARPGWFGVSNILVRIFFAWYVPLYERCSTAARRAHELDGDHYMMELVNDVDVAELLGARIIAERYLEEKYLEAIRKLARKSAEPPPIFYSGLDRKFNRYWSTEDAKRWMQIAFAETPSPGDPRPSYKQHLARIGHRRPRLPSPLREAASRELFGAALKRVLLHLDREWAREQATRWSKLNQAATLERRKLTVLYKKSQKTALSANEATALATLVEEYHGKAKAFPFYKSLAKKHAGHAGANFALGRFLLAANDARGLDFLDRAAAIDEGLRERAEDLMKAYHAERRRESGVGEFPAIAETQMPIVVDESQVPLSGTGIRKAISQLGEHGAITDERLREAITGTRTAAEVAAAAQTEEQGESGLHRAISETGVRGAAAVQSGLEGTVTRAGLSAVPKDVYDDKPAPKDRTPGETTDLDVALARTAQRGSSTAARVQAALTDSAVRKAISDTNLRKRVQDN